MKRTVFLVITKQRFKEMCCFHLQGRRVSLQYIPKQDKKYTYDVILRSVRLTIVTMESQ